eukprot:TRINITY_DN37350_c0_g1_i1.p1 TRINITY_DN37350_c0_g1~~TRINITY_DN37350_c0_g1_i1.p1  ORF type:complete len:279 (+),score=43.03 TRINITY_DN37350_c0_g1_i1:143-979(+)
MSGTQSGSAIKKHRRKRQKHQPILTPTVRSLKHARKVTGQFHRLTHSIASCADDGARAQLEEKLENMGGRAAYQEASIKATGDVRHTSRWMFSILTKLGRRPAKGQPKLRTLEVGAVNTQILVIPWLDVTAIDLRSTDPMIQTQDFFDRPPCRDFDAVMCSMVINCVPTPEKRGEMLLRLRAQLRPTGLLFLILPLRCLTHSKRCSVDHFEAMMSAAGFTIREKKNSPKVAFFCLEATHNPSKGDLEPFVGEPQVINPGRRHTAVSYTHLTLPTKRIV